jgi:hypothetical protein
MLRCEVRNWVLRCAMPEEQLRRGDGKLSPLYHPMPRVALMEFAGEPKLHVRCLLQRDGPLGGEQPGPGAHPAPVSCPACYAYPSADKQCSCNATGVRLCQGVECSNDLQVCEYSHRPCVTYLTVRTCRPASVTRAVVISTRTAWVARTSTARARRSTPRSLSR